MLWVFQDNIFHEAFFPKMLSFLDKMEIPYIKVKAVPFTGDMLPQPEITGPTIAIGSYSFTNKAIALGWKPGSWTNENFDYRVWSQHWKCLNEGQVYKFGEVPFQKFPFFIRPCADDKLFTGHVLDWGDFAEWRHKVINLADDNTTIDLKFESPVLISSVKDIDSEFRFVIVDNKVVTGSSYGRHVIQQEVEPHKIELLEFVNEQIAKWTPAKVFTLDIALCDGEYFVLEMGNFNSAGLYECDVQKIVMAIEDLIPI